MKDYTCFNYNFLFGDHFAKISQKAKLYYIKLNFYANNGFVPNPMSVLDSLGYDKSIYQELVGNGELLTLPDRCEVFITSYFLHNPGLKVFIWRDTPYAVYWEGKLHVKKNGVATFKPQGLEPDEKLSVEFIQPKLESAPDPNEPSWDEVLEGLDCNEKGRK